MRTDGTPLKNNAAVLTFPQSFSRTLFSFLSPHSSITITFLQTQKKARVELKPMGRLESVRSKNCARSAGNVG